MTYGQLAKFIEKMSEAQRQMPVIVLSDEFLTVSLILHVDEDTRTEEGFAEDQPILTQAALLPYIGKNMRERLDLTPEEREDCIKDYTDEYKNSSGTVFYEALYRGKLIKLGLDRDEVDYLVRLNSPTP